MSKIRVAILENDSVEFGGVVEHELQANEVDFNPDGDNFPAEIVDVQAAIEYAKQSAEGFPRSGLALVMNGVMGNGDWVSYSNLTPDVPIVFPVNSVVKEVTWANEDGNTNRSFDLEFYKNGEASGDLYYTWEVRNSTNHYGYIDSLNHLFSAGDYMRIKYIDQGLNCSDFIVTIWFARVV